MWNPIEAFQNLSSKGKIAVGAGAVGVAGLLYWRSKNKASTAVATDSDSDTTDDAVTTDETYPDDLGDGGLYDPTSSIGAGGYYGGYGSTTPAALDNGDLTSEDPGGTLNSPQPVNIYLGNTPGADDGTGTNSPDTSGSGDATTGGGAPASKNAAVTHLVNADPGSPRKGESYTTVKNADGSTTHVYSDGTKIRMPAATKFTGTTAGKAAPAVVQGHAAAVNTKVGSQGKNPTTGQSYTVQRIKAGKNSGTYHVYADGHKVLVGKY